MGIGATNSATPADFFKGRIGRVVVWNAAAAIIVAGLADDFEAAVELADTSVTGGRALAALEKLIEVSNASDESQNKS